MGDTDTGATFTVMSPSTDMIAVTRTEDTDIHRKIRVTVSLVVLLYCFNALDVLLFGYCVSE